MIMGLKMITHLWLFYAPSTIDRGHIVLPMFVRLSADSSYNAYIRFAGSFQQYPTSEGHSMKVKVEYQGYISQKMAVLGALVFHKHILCIFFKMAELKSSSFLFPDQNFTMSSRENTTNIQENKEM